MTQARRSVVRARAIAQARPAPVAARWWVWLLLGLAALSAQALAQDNPPSPPNTIPAPGSVQATQPNAPATATGVIRPPAHVDPGITAKPPVPPAALPTPVIPPPASSGGEPVQPK